MESFQMPPRDLYITILTLNRINPTILLCYWDKTVLLKIFKITPPLLLPYGLLQVFSHNPQVLVALRVLWHVPSLPLETLLRKFLALAFVLGLEARVEVADDTPAVMEGVAVVVVMVDIVPPTASVVVDTVAEVRVEVEMEAEKLVEVEAEVGKFEKAVREFVGFGEGTLIAGGVPVGCLGSLGRVCLQGTFLQVPSFP
jgi:hypothetical protein